ncbi:hypothetical protein FQV27_07975 [Paracoccus aurantiacus]|uniref:Uncharacterized protein n=1 Tax=Paracoccus aurantiacus TaxID=2599412 RepID=A0A5C6S6N6_9RHOB|nr:hypothetical protein [Paracoccus aurantiacus]TXB70023.1 hypothetical protein FQV27_07975 [Paracoccus aurantiacus]
MSVHRPPALVLLALAACGPAATAQQAEGDRKAQFIATIESLGCSVTDEQAETLPQMLEFTPDETDRFIGELIIEERAMLKGNVLTLKTENCR